MSTRFLVGRATTCDLRLTDAMVSGLHAEISFRAGAWLVKDLGSRNGTFVDGQLLARGTLAHLSAKSQLSFGPNCRFVMVDVSPPNPFARWSRGTVEGERQMLSLPSSDDVIVSVVEDRHGCWLLERGTSVYPVQDGDKVEVAGVEYQLSLPSRLETRTSEGELKRLAIEANFHFFVSRDREHVALDVSLAEESVSLKPRVHLQVLAHLAQARITDGLRGLPDAECGWLYRETVMDDLKTDNQTLNLWIHRARQQLASAVDLEGATQIVERRPDSDQMRFGPARVRIECS